MGPQFEILFLSTRDSTVSPHVEFIIDTTIVTIIYYEQHVTYMKFQDACIHIE